MSNIDKRALREAAEKATDSRARLELMESVFDDDGDVTPEVQDDISICMSFNGLTNPATVLALLDELEVKDKRIAELTEIFRSGRKFISEYAGLGDVSAAEFIKIIDRAVANKEIN